LGIPQKTKNAEQKTQKKPTNTAKQRQQTTIILNDTLILTKVASNAIQQLWVKP
jgi:hypothetical protein